MNRNEFNKFIAGIDLPGPEDLEELRELIALFPWFHSAHMLLLRGLKENNDIRFDSQLKVSALSVTDREVLYHYLFLAPEEVAAGEASAWNSAAEQVPTAASVADETPVIEAVEEVPAPEEVPEVEEAPVPVEVPEVEEVPAPKEVPEVDEAPVHLEFPEVEEAPVPVGVPEVEMISGAEDAAESVTVTEGAKSQPVEWTPEEEEVHIITSEQPAEWTPEEGESPVITSEQPADEITGDNVLYPEAGPTEEEVVILPVEQKVDLTENIRTREELMAEIEERLRELEEIHKAAADQVAQQVQEQPGPVAESVPDEVPAPGPEPAEASIPEVMPELIPEPEPLTEHDFVPGIELEWQPEAVPDSEAEAWPVEEELLELIPDEPVEESEPVTQLAPAELIDRFIRINPSIERLTPGEVQPVKDLSAPSTEEQGKFITETLAKIYINQGYYSRAINIYEKLSLQYPEKSAYFASRIEKIKELIK